MVYDKSLNCLLERCGEGGGKLVVVNVKCAICH